MLKLPLKPARGFTLIEMMIGITLLAILMALAVPNFSRWIRNLEIRGTAEAVLSGLTLARTEAVKKNTVVYFQLIDTIDEDCELNPSGPHWVVSLGEAAGRCNVAPSDTESPRIVQIHDGNQGGGNRARITAGQSLFTFNGLGRLTSTAAGILVSDADGEEGCVSADGGKARCLRIEVNAGGVIRMCDPALPSTDTQGCG